MKAPLRLDRDAYFAWAEAQPRGRFERVEGEVIEVSPENWEHARLKAEIWRALDAALSGVPGCRVTPNGMTVSVGANTDYEPDVAVHCGAAIPRKSLTIPNPVLIVEVLSPSTMRIDTTVKREGYLGVPSVEHYLIFRADRRELTHWRRGADAPATHRSGRLRFDPPGITLDLDAIYDRAEAA